MMRIDRGRIVVAILCALFAAGCVNLRSKEVVVVGPSWSYTDQTAAAGVGGRPVARIVGSAAVVARGYGMDDLTRKSPFNMEQSVEAGPAIE